MERPTQVTGRRIVAFLIDGILGFGIFIALVVAFGDKIETPGFSGFSLETVNDATALRINESAWLLEGSKGTTVQLLAAAWWILNLVVLNAAGGSVGKLLTGIRVVRPDGSRCGIGKAIIRWLLLIVDAFPYFAPIVGFVCVLATSDNRRVGDMAAGTYVVRSSAAGTPIATATAPTGPYAYAQATAPPPPAPDAQWDAARNAWIRWSGESWLGYDATTGTWNPL